MKIIISNNLHLTSIPSDLRSDLMEKLKFINPKWIENERMGRWNRDTPKILRYYQRKANNGLLIPRGFMRQLLLMCQRMDISVTIDDKRRKLKPMDFTFDGKLKDFQQKAVDIMLAKDFGTLSAPTGSGKTVMALYMISQRRQPALVIVHTKELAFQWMEKVKTFLNIPEAQIGFIGGGKKNISSKITIALIQSLYKCTSQIAPQIGYLVVDECHRAPSRTFTEAVIAFDAQYMLGLSATPWRRDRLSKLIFWHLGDVHCEVPKAHLVASGHICKTEVIVRKTVFKPYYDPVTEYSKMLSELTNDDTRNRQIVADVAREIQKNQRPGACLVLSDRKRHCKSLQTLLTHKYHVDSEILTGDLNLDQRRHVIQQLQHGYVRVLFATGQLIGEGFDCSCLSTLFLTTPVRFSGRILQYLGRILRPAQGIERARVYDYVDVFVEPLVAAARARQRVYDAK